MPTLDTEWWLNTDWTISYSFYKKLISTKYCVMAESACPDAQKLAVLSQEVIRRMMHISLYVAHEEKIAVLDRFCQMMSVSGYHEERIKEVVTRGLKGYHNQLRKAQEAGNINLHRRGSATRKERQLKKILSKTTWYKKRQREEDDTKQDSPNKKRKIKGKQTNSYEDPASVLFVVRTPRGDLATEL